MKLWYVMPYISQLKVCFSCQESPLYLQAFYLVAYTFQVKALCFLVFQNSDRLAPHVFDTSAQCKLGCIVGPENPLQIRILFHIAHRQNDEKVLLEYHMKLGEGHEDQLSLASIHYLRTHYQEAIDIYKRILLKTR